ncbi:MAG: NADH-quinone oxidoreductase subunit N, partial [Chloroflexi bacterium]|nr:NADH-quinone oxidoreductase subunit N [Chloroflexota bacterium]
MDDLNLLGPQLALLIGAGLIIIVDLLLPIVSRQAYQGRLPLLSGLALLAAAGSLGWSLALVLTDERGEAFDGMISVDDFTLFFNFLFAAVAGAIVLGSVDYLARHRFQGEYLALILIAAAGMSLMAAGTDLIMIFIALELQAIALFALVGISKNESGSEATLKFLLLSAISTAITLYGMAYLFGLSGETSLDGIASYVANTDENRSALVLAAVFLTAGLGFKMAVVPFQMWVPDVYEGAPTPITAFLSVASKAAGFAVVMRIFLAALGEGLITTDWAYLFAAIAAVSMTLGNVLALVQGNIKRMLGYSSIAQAGTILIGLAAVAAEDPQLLLGTSSVVFFLGAYAFTNIGAFIAIIAISHKIGSDQI